LINRKQNNLQYATPTPKNFEGVKKVSDFVKKNLYFKMDTLRAKQKTCCSYKYLSLGQHVF